VNLGFAIGGIALGFENAQLAFLLRFGESVSGLGHGSLGIHLALVIRLFALQRFFPLRRFGPHWRREPGPIRVPRHSHEWPFPFSASATFTLASRIVSAMACLPSASI
jgi:hypothetical protein